MDDPAFPDSHYTSTTTGTATTTTVQSPPITVDRSYLTSVPGILRIVEICVNLLYWILLAACSYYVGFPLSVSISSWVITIFLFVVFLLQLNKRLTVIHWVLTELLHDLVWVVLHLIAASIVAHRAASLANYSVYIWVDVSTYHGCTSFAAVLGFALMILYGVSAFFDFRIFQAGGGLSQLSRGGARAGATANTSATTTTVTTTEYNVDKGGDMPPPYPNQ